MTEPIKPALTAEAWRMIERSTISIGFDYGFRWQLEDATAGEYSVLDQSGRLLTPGERHQIAALCLYGQPFGFDKYEVALVRDAISAHWTIHGRGRATEALEHFAAKLAALLPLEDSIISAGASEPAP